MRNGAGDPNTRADMTDPESVCMHSVQGGCRQSQAGQGRQRSSQANRDHIWLMVLSLLTWCGVLWLEQCACTSECMELGTIQGKLSHRL